jgi:peptide/nickel transport system permease protein
MLAYIGRRILAMVPTLFGMSLISFLIIQLPPGDYLTSLVASMQDNGQTIDPAQIERLKAIYGLGQPFYVQYWKSLWGILSRGDFGFSFQWNRPVAGLLWSVMGPTLLISVLSLLFVWAVSLPIGIYTAVRRHSAGDHVFTLIGFIGLAVPNFILALNMMFLAYRYLGFSVGGLYSPEFADAPWSGAKLLDLLAHLWIPVVIIGASGTAALIRVLRANLTDELHKPYVITARARACWNIASSCVTPCASRSTRSSPPWLGAAASRLRRHHRRDRAQPAHRRSAALPRAGVAGHVSRRQLHPDPERADPGRHARLRPPARAA